MKNAIFEIDDFCEWCMNSTDDMYAASCRGITYERYYNSHTNYDKRKCTNVEYYHRIDGSWRTIDIYNDVILLSLTHDSDDDFSIDTSLFSEEAYFQLSTIHDISLLTYEEISSMIKISKTLHSRY